MEKDSTKLSESEKKKEDWMNSKWRPMMGWLYMATCTFDFVLFPVLWSLLQAVTKVPITQWQPLTLQGAGLYHIAMGAVLGLAAFGRTQEKLAGANNGNATATTGFSSGVPALGSPPTGFGTQTGSLSTQVPVSILPAVPAVPTSTLVTTPGFNGTSNKPAPAAQPEL